MQIPKLQRAIIQSDHAGALIQTSKRPIPTPGPNQALIKTAAVALNPCDWKMSTAFPTPGAGCGSDYAGSVVSLGSAVTDLREGDRVAGAVHANNPVSPESGAYAEYSVVDVDQLWRIPDSMSWAEAATIGLCGIGTVGMAAWYNLNLPGTPEKPSTKNEWILVYGASTANGTVAVQTLKRSGFRVIGTCSPHNFDMVTSFGADKVLDYHSATCAQDIRNYTENNLTYAMDIIADAKSVRACYAALGRAGGRYVGFELVPEELTALRKTIQASWVLGIRMSGREIALERGYGFPANAELREFGCDLARRVEGWAYRGEIRPHPAIIHRDGLDGIITGIEKLRQRQVSGQKLVYLI